MPLHSLVARAAFYLLNGLFSNQYVIILSDRNGVRSIMNVAKLDWSIMFCMNGIGANAKINNKIKTIRYTSKKPNNAPNAPFTNRINGKSAIKSSIVANI